MTTTEIAEAVGGRLRGPGDVPIRGIEALDQAAADEITFVTKGAFLRAWSASSAAAALVASALDARLANERRPIILVDSVEHATVRVLEAFAPPAEPPDVGCHASAVVGPEARIDPSARVGPHVSVGRGAIIGQGVTLYAGARIGAEVVIGAGTVVHENTVIRDRCRIGQGVLIHQNVSIGADGFGFAPRLDGRGLVKVPHIGRVDVGDGVEIGAGTCIDRAKFGATVVGDGTKLDNLIQVGHNVRIGRSCVIAAGTLIGGSVTIGDGVRVGGGVKFKDHVRVGSGAAIGGATMITGDVGPGEEWFGAFPAARGYQALRQFAAVRKLPGLIRSLSGSD